MLRNKTAQIYKNKFPQRKKFIKIINLQQWIIIEQQQTITVCITNDLYASLRISSIEVRFRREGSSTDVHNLFPLKFTLRIKYSEQNMPTMKLKRMINTQTKKFADIFLPANLRKVLCLWQFFGKKTEFLCKPLKIYHKVSCAIKN